MHSCLVADEGFSELVFLDTKGKKPNDSRHQEAKTKTKNKKRTAADKEEEMSRYFSTRGHPVRSLEGLYHNQRSMVPVPVLGESDAISCPSAPIDYEERQFLGFGEKPTPIPNLSRGSSPRHPLNQRSQSSRSITGYTWSQSDRVSVPHQKVSTPRNITTRGNSGCTAFEESHEIDLSAIQESGNPSKTPNVSQPLQPTDDLTHPIDTEQISMSGHTCDCKPKRESKDVPGPETDLNIHPSLWSCRIEGPSRSSEDQTCPATSKEQGMHHKTLGDKSRALRPDLSRTMEKQGPEAFDQAFASLRRNHESIFESATRSTHGRAGRSSPAVEQNVTEQSRSCMSPQQSHYTMQKASRSDPSPGMLIGLDTPGQCVEGLQQPSLCVSDIAGADVEFPTHIPCAWGEYEHVGQSFPSRLVVPQDHLAYNGSNPKSSHHNSGTLKLESGLENIDNDVQYQQHDAQYEWLEGEVERQCHVLEDPEGSAYQLLYDSDTEAECITEQHQGNAEPATQDIPERFWRPQRLY